MQAVEWAECGIGGAPHSPYDVFVTAFGSKLAADQFTAGLGDEWAIADGYHKVHACCQYSHSTVEAIMDLYGQFGERLQKVRSVSVETHPLGMTLNNREPATSLAAKFSIPHIAAAACLYGHAGAEAFNGARLNEAPLAMLREKVELVPYDNVPAWPNDRPARVTVTLDDGSVHTSECISARGGPDKPFGADVIEAKINGIMTPAYPSAPVMMNRCIALDRSLLSLSWRDVVAGLRFNKSPVVRGCDLAIRGHRAPWRAFATRRGTKGPSSMVLHVGGQSFAQRIAKRQSDQFHRCLGGATHRFGRVARPTGSL